MTQTCGGQVHRCRLSTWSFFEIKSRTNKIFMLKYANSLRHPRHLSLATHTAHSISGLVVSCSYRVSLSASVRILLSLTPTSCMCAGMTHAAATTGPARGPRPASSTPDQRVGGAHTFRCERLSGKHWYMGIIALLTGPLFLCPASIEYSTRHAPAPTCYALEAAPPEPLLQVTSWPYQRFL